MTLGVRAGLAWICFFHADSDEHSRAVCHASGQVALTEHGPSEVCTGYFIAHDQPHCPGLIVSRSHPGSRRVRFCHHHQLNHNRRVNVKRDLKRPHHYTTTPPKAWTPSTRPGCSNPTLGWIAHSTLPWTTWKNLLFQCLPTLWVVSS